MKIAVLLPGQPRFISGFHSIFTELKGYESADWYAYLTNNNQRPEQHPRYSNYPDNWVSAGSHIPESWLNYDPAWARETLQSWMPLNHKLKRLEISDCEIYPLPKVPPDRPPSAYRMWYNIFRCNQLVEQEYDLVIKYRADVTFIHSVDLQQIDRNTISSSIENPDVVAIGTQKQMSIYSNLIWNTDRCQREDWDPERILDRHLTNNNIKRTLCLPIKLR